ncbi:hypothetical protein P8452_00797 [Trifolium repens]|nr:hypothetical protein P8452_00797 [Trifolium repens]
MFLAQMSIPITVAFYINVCCWLRCSFEQAVLEMYFYFQVSVHPEFGCEGAHSLIHACNAAYTPYKLTYDIQEGNKNNTLPLSLLKSQV